MSCTAVNFSIMKNSSSLCPLLTIFLNYERAVLGFSDKRCGKLPNESNGHFHAPRKTVEHVTHCCVTTRCCILQRSNDTSVSRLRSESRSIATHNKAVQASMRHCAANKFEFLTFPNMLPECDVPRIRSNRQTTVRRGRRVSSHVSNDFLFLLLPTSTCDTMF